MYFSGNRLCIELSCPGRAFHSDAVVGDSMVTSMSRPTWFLMSITPHLLAR
jgi:hypothetical protein